MYLESLAYECIHVHTMYIEHNVLQEKIQKTLPQNPSKFCIFSSAKVLREFRETLAEEFCNFDGRSGLLTLCISAMI